jgi:homoserine kinase type II
MTPLEKVWGLTGPFQFRTLANGTNNQMQRVETPGGSYVLRVYRNHADLARLRFEHDLLRQLDVSALPFAVPAPIPTAAGESYVRIATEKGEALVTLTALIGGEHPQRDDLGQAEAAGEALALLDVALSRITPAYPQAAISWRSYGDLERCHPLVPDPRSAIAELPIADDARCRLLACYEGLMQRVPAVYASLPQQLVHEDCEPSNLLMLGHRVTGVLDFEFCARDVQVMDLTVALSWWPVERFGTGEEWLILRALARGYARHITLTADDIAAIPLLFQLRTYTSLIHRLGRHRQGLSPLEAVVERAEAVLAREDWLATNGGRLVETVRDSSG